MQQIPPPIVHQDKDFKPFIKSLLKKAKLKDKYVDMLTNDYAMLEWTKVFTTKEIDPYYNYELYETFGDATGNKITVWYYKQRFPDIFGQIYVKSGSMGPVDILSKLKGKGVSKIQFGNYGIWLGLKKFIRSSDEEKNSISLEEDVFEAFLGCLETLVDKYIGNFVGYGVCYTFMEPLMNRVKISLERDDLYDPKSLINEEITKHNQKQLIKIEYVETRLEDQQHEVKLVLKNFKTGQTIYQTNTFTSYKKKDAEKAAAKEAYKNGIIQFIEDYVKRNS